ncbi:MAG: HepT-like ribonuclease domain-containing protein [Bacteroidota bacterium]
MTARLSEDFRKQHTNIEWSKIDGFRNIIAHDYFGVDDKVVWQIIQNKLPELKDFLTKNLSL